MPTLAAPSEVVATLGETLLSTDARRTLFEGLSSGDQTILAEQATADLAALVYDGYATGDVDGVPFPRAAHNTDEQIDPDPNEPADALVPGVPRRVRQAHAIQCGFLAREAAGMGDANRLAQAAHGGVASASQQGRSEGIDLARANSARAWRSAESTLQSRRYS